MPASDSARAAHAPRTTAFAPLATLQKRLGYQFRQPTLLQRALTHRSFGADNNERLEFLGDSVLGLAVSSLLFRRLANVPEGSLSRMRSHLVCEESLHRMACRLGLPEVLRLSEGESRSGGRQRPSILADALEAILGAVYLDSDFATAESVVHRLLDDVEIHPQMHAAQKDAKTALQEWLQARKYPIPEYEVLQVVGAAHQQIFEVACTVPKLRLATTGTGQNRRAGEQQAAHAMLELLKKR